MQDRAIALCRVSTVKQSIEGTSLEAQEQRVYDAAMYLDTEIVKFWSIKVSSRKGKNYQRKDLLEMLAYAKADRKVKYIIVDEPDRFMRDFEMYYHWKVLFREEAGAKLVYAKKPHLVHETSMIALMEEMFDVFRGEADNESRINKTTTNMQARVKLGYFPGVTKAGYKKTETPGLFAPREPEWSLLREFFLSILDGLSIKDAVANLNAKGYKTPKGGHVDLFNFKRFMKDPYYAGVIAMSDWEINPNGLHRPMISMHQHEQLRAIAEGIKYKPRKKFRPEFLLSNIMECTECLNANPEKAPRLVGYDHNNGKKGNSYKTYRRYRCRNCGASFLRDELHEILSGELLGLRLSEQRKEEFVGALRKVWEQDTATVQSRAVLLERRLDELKSERSKVLRNALNNNFNEDDTNQCSTISIRTSVE